MTGKPKLAAALASAIFIALLSGCQIFGIGAKAEATVTGHKADPMNAYEIVDYTVTNTGSLKLATVNLDFKVTCENGSSYRDTTMVSDLEVGASVSGDFWIAVNETSRPVKTVAPYKVTWTTW